MIIRVAGAAHAALLNEELTAALGAGMFIGRHSADEVFVECADEDEADAMAVITAHLARTQQQQDAAVRDWRARGVVDATDRVAFEHLFDLENRTRVLESRPTITKQQYRQALIDRWKQLN